jgi:hypothetical protein
MFRSYFRSLPLWVALAFSTALVIATAVRPVSAFPKPSVFPISWELKFEHSAPKRIVVRTPGTINPVAYWYMTFTVTNNTSEEQRFLPVFEMLMGDGTVIRSDKEIPAGVFDEIRKRERRKSLEPMEKIAGRLLIGEDQARDGVAIWREPTTRMGTFHIFAGGLSGETVIMKEGQEIQIKDWTKVTDAEKKKLTTLRKTLDMTYQIPGDEIKPEEDAINSQGEEWVMR